MTRLERLRLIDIDLERRDVDMAELIATLLPGWFLIDGTVHGDWRVESPDQKHITIMPPLASVDGALWLAKHALPESLWPPTLVPEGDYSALCEFEEMPSGRAFRRAAGALPIAICRAVVAALIAIEERMEPRLQQIGQEFDRGTANQAKAG